MDIEKAKPLFIATFKTDITIVDLHFSKSNFITDKIAQERKSDHEKNTYLHACANLALANSKQRQF